jgi:hypothetical protein
MTNDKLPERWVETPFGELEHLMNDLSGLLAEVGMMKPRFANP